MRFKTNRNIAIVDIDGVIVANPVESIGKGTIVDRDFWSRHWNNPDDGILQPEMLALVQSLISTNWQVVFLTARPAMFRGVTERLLFRAGFFPRPHPDVVPNFAIDITGHNSSILQMWPETFVGTSSAAWKQGVVKQMVDDGLKVQLMVEDYRTNSEAIRAVVPVLLYESKRPSRYGEMLNLCGKCGGAFDYVTGCWCPPPIGLLHAK